MNAALRRFSRRQILTRPGRTLLTLMSIVLGVAAISAVEMLSVSIRGASLKMFATVAGDASLTIQAVADATIAESYVAKVANVEGVEAAVPMIQRVGSFILRRDGKQKKVRGEMVGIDPNRVKALRDYEVVDGEFFTDKPPPVDPETGEEDERLQMVLDENFATGMGLKVGSEVRAMGFGFDRKFRVVGLVRSTSYAGAVAGSLAYIQLSDLQDLIYRGKPKLTAIQIKTNGKVPDSQVAAKINEFMPAGLKAQVPSGRTAVLEQTMNPTEQGLKVAVVFVTMLAAFIVFNTFMMNVSERRRQMAIIRAVGGTRSQLFMILLTESVFMGVLGTAIGLFVGYQGTVFATKVLGTVLEVSFPAAVLTPWIAAKASAFGVGIAVIGAIYPALKASQLTPLEAMSPLQHMEEDRIPWIAMVISAALLAGGGGMLYAAMQDYIPIDFGVYSALVMLLGMVVLAESVMLAPGAVFVSSLIQPLFGVTSTLARRQIIRHQTRSALTAGVLFVAASTGIGLSCVILDTVQNVRDWYHRTIIGDFYVRVALPDFATGESPETPEEFDQRIDDLDPAKLLARKDELHRQIGTAMADGKNNDVMKLTEQAKLVDDLLAHTPVASIDRGRMVNTKIKKVGASEGVDTKLGAREYPTLDHARFDIVEGEKPEVIYQRFMEDRDRRRARRQAGEKEDPADPANIPPIVVSSVVAKNADIHAGDIVEIDTPTGPRKVHVLGINNEYLVGGLLIWMHRQAANDLLGIEGYDGYILMSKPGEDNRKRLYEILHPLTSEYGLLLQSFAQIHTTIEGIIRSTDFMLWGLVLVEFVVASFGMVNTLTMSVLEQTRELGLLRIIAMTRAQVRKTIEAQAIILGLMGIVPGIAVGLLIAFLMNKATYTTIAHPVQFGFHPWMVLGTLAGSLALVILAAFVPAFRASRINVLKALQYE